MSTDEKIEIVDQSGNVIGVRSRKEVHNDPSLLHRTVHCIVINDNKEVLLQKRSNSKDIQPGKWDTSVGGHVDPGESIYEAVKRETEEELGVRGIEFRHLYQYIMQSSVETEMVDTFMIKHNGPFRYSITEIDEVAFFSEEEISEKGETGIFTSNFLEEWKKFKDLV